MRFIEELRNLTVSINKKSDFKQMGHWIPFDSNDSRSHPIEYDRYFVCRKDGKIHLETWNTSGWAYNHNEIRFWAYIISPINE